MDGLAGGNGVNARPRRSWAAWIVQHRKIIAPILIFLLAFSVYQTREDYPARLVSDEHFYVRAARNLANGIYLEDNSTIGLRPENHVHPPLGKLIIAASLILHGKPGNEYIHDSYPQIANYWYVYGQDGNSCGYVNPQCADDARAWRLPATLFGALGVLAAYFVALQLFNRFSAALAAAGLLLLDGLYFLHSRVSNLEVYAAAFTLGAFAFALARWRGSGILAGLAYGAALATKLNTLFLLPIFLVVLLRREPWLRWPQFPAWLPRATSTAAWGFLLPAAVFVAAYAPFLNAWADLGGWTYAWEQWWVVQVDAVRFHQTIDFEHLDDSHPILWIPMAVPVGFWTTTHEKAVYVWALGNPFLWWTAAAALVVVPARVLWRFSTTQPTFQAAWDRMRDMLMPTAASSRDVRMLLAAALFWCAYLPFFLLDRPMFLYYMAFLVPFLAIFAGGLVGEAWDRGGRHRKFAIAYAALALLTFLYFLPIVTGIPIEPAWHYRIMHTVPWMQNR